MVISLMPLSMFFLCQSSPPLPIHTVEFIGICVLPIIFLEQILQMPEQSGRSQDCGRFIGRIHMFQQKLRIDISLLSRSVQIMYCFFFVLRYITAIKIQLSKNAVVSIQ